MEDKFLTGRLYWVWYGRLDQWGICMAQYLPISEDWRFWNMWKGHNFLYSQAGKQLIGIGPILDEPENLPDES